MQHDIAELRERLDWCRTKAATLHISIGTEGKASVRAYNRPWGPGASSGSIEAELLRQPSVALRSEIGMIVNEQRAILDALACALATRAGANNISDVYFPVTRDRAGFADHGVKKIRKLSAQDRAAIEDLKPWLPGEDGEGNELLFLLHEADRVRKHQKLLKWACLGGVDVVGSGAIGMLQNHTAVFHEVGQKRQLATYSNITAPLGVRFEVVYAEPATLEGRSVSALLTGFTDTVATILDSF